jgi:hypothetical protein
MLFIFRYAVQTYIFIGFLATILCAAACFFVFRRCGVRRAGVFSSLEKDL